MPQVNLVVVAHPDDEILGFGGTGATLAAQGETVQPVILCGNVTARTQRPGDNDLHDDTLAANKIVGFNVPIMGDFPNIRMNTVDHIDLVQFIETQIRAFHPKRIFCHHPADLNDDHLQVSKATTVAARLGQRDLSVPAVKTLAYMEISSSTDWSVPGPHPGFTPNMFFEIKDHLNTKIDAMHQYRNVVRPFPHARSEEAMRGLAAYRGGQAGLHYAEAFQLAFQTGL